MAARRCCSSPTTVGWPPGWPTRRSYWNEDASSAEQRAVTSRRPTRRSRRPPPPANALPPSEPADSGSAPGTVRTHALTVAGAEPSRPRLAATTLAFTPGSRTLVTGLSGAGKTTLARALAGLTPATSGTVEVDGVRLPLPVERRDRAALRTVQYVHQDARASFDEYRPVVGQLTRTAVLLRGLPSARALDEVAGLAGRLGLRTADLARRPTALSGGQLQRAALIRAVTARPALLVCDEVTSALDPATAGATVRLLMEESEEHGMAVLFVTHDSALFTPVAQRRLRVAEGRWM